MPMALGGKQARFVAEYIKAHFAGLVGEGISNGEVAIRAGYAPKSAHVQACELLKNPNVSAAIEKGKKRMERATKISVEDHLEQLEELRDKALAAGNIGAAVRAEELRGKVSGHYVDLTKDVSDDLSDEQIIIQIKNDVDADAALKLARGMGMSADKLREIFGADVMGPKAA